MVIIAVGNRISLPVPNPAWNWVRWTTVVNLSASVGIPTRTTDGFSNLLKRPQKNREFSYIAERLHFSVLALRMHSGYS
jgi:hypothetical protein